MIIWYGTIVIEYFSTMALKLFISEAKRTGLNTVAANLLMTGDGTNSFNTVAVGTSGQVLLSAGSGTDPSFGHVDGGTF